MAGPSLFANLARAAKVLALLLFFLPWVTVSCSPQALERLSNDASRSAPQLNMGRSGPGAGVPIADASGLNMALGQVRMLLPSAARDGRAEGPGRADQPPDVPVEIGVIAGAVLTLLALLASFLLKGPAGAIAGIGGSVLAMIALCYSVFVNYPAAVRMAFAARSPSGTGGGENVPTADQIAQILSVKPEAGFWLVLLALALAILFNALVMRKPSATVAPAVAAPPPAEPPAAI